MANPVVLCLGELLIDFMPLDFGTSIVTKPQLRWAAGGAPANVAVGLARLGCPSGFVGKVGDDFFGHYLQELLAENGVDTAGLRFETKANTGLAFVSWKDHDAHYLFYRSPSADTLLEPADLDENYLKQARLLQFGSLMLATRPAANAILAALEIGAQAGLLLTYDLNLRTTGWPNPDAARAAVSKPLDYTSILKINRTELAFLTGEGDPEIGTKKLWREGFKLIVVTLDKEGSYYRTETAQGFAPAFPAQVLDTVGAGDGFLAGLLDRLWRSNFDFEDEKAVREACQQAAAVGAIVVGRSGAIPAMPTRAEVDQFLKTKLS